MEIWFKVWDPFPLFEGQCPGLTSMFPVWFPACRTCWLGRWQAFRTAHKCQQPWWVATTGQDFWTSLEKGKTARRNDCDLDHDIASVDWLHVCGFGIPNYVLRCFLSRTSHGQWSGSAMHCIWTFQIFGWPPILHALMYFQLPWNLYLTLLIQVYQAKRQQ